MLLAGAIVAVVTGVCGIYLCAKRARIWCNMLVGLFFLIGFVLLFINGIAIAFVSGTSPAKLQEFCQAPTNTQSYVIKALRTVIDEVDSSIVNVASQEMCSSICPCAPNANQTQWTSLTSAQLAEYNRTLAWNFNGNSTNSFDTFTDCMNYMVTNAALYAKASSSNNTSTKA